ncbi:cation transporter [Luteimonas sp. Sa2BVA3]|jgi:cation diffusion facilitator family transporter|uniref:Cation transporter n=1 Tax=Luteimonas colneyensis TaxID=2762230 RepID=A0ABR8UH68_9GAMM|nr:cation diffusion facilitator family transporter [Luteimonas colneyensis]MBD7987356.1 cation transporter [Luteimonas colneyensis]
MDNTGSPPATRPDLRKYAWLAIAAAVLTVLLKTAAWAITGSVGLLSDAAESLVNLVAAIVALVSLTIAARPADEDHHFGHSKAEYFSAALEGIMVFLAAASIIYLGIERLLNPRPLESLGIGLAVSMVAAVLNGVVGRILIRVGERHRSITLRADGKHLMTDVYTSVGVVIGLGLAWLSGWTWVDPVIAILVGVNILFTGYRLISESTAGLMDASLSPEDNARIQAILDAHTEQGRIEFHAVRTRESGSRQFMEMHMLVPGDWTVQRGHDAMEDLVELIVAQFPAMSVTGHLEPVADPRSYEDMAL